MMSPEDRFTLFGIMLWASRPAGAQTAAGMSCREWAQAYWISAPGADRADA